MKGLAIYIIVIMGLVLLYAFSQLGKDPLIALLSIGVYTPILIFACLSLKK